MHGISFPLLCVVRRFFALPLPDNASNSKALPLRRQAQRCPAGPCLCASAPFVAIPLLFCAMLFWAMPLHNTAPHFQAMPPLRNSISMLRSSSPGLASPSHCPAYHRHRLAKQCLSTPCLCVALHHYVSLFLCDPTPFLAMPIRNKAFRSQAKQSLCLAPHRAAAPCLAMLRRCPAATRHAMPGGSYALPNYAERRSALAITLPVLQLRCK
jgi:hypothetical protein